MNKRIAIIVSLVAVAALCIALMMFGGRKDGGDSPKEVLSTVRSDKNRPAKSTARTVRKPVRSSRGDKAKRPEKPILSFAEDDDEDDDFTPEERALSKRIEAALDEEDLNKAVACAKEALNCQNVEIRQAMVDALGWFGAKGLPELTPFLADSDEDVRDSAMNEWSMALSDIDDEPEKLGVVEAVESLLRIIEVGGSEQGIAKAKETYEFVTGDEFTSRAAAEKWIAEEYQPPEEPQQEQTNQQE